jgi:glycolate oxidase FAD binding subunit
VPTAVAELRELVRHAAESGQALYPLGGQTMLGFGLPPTRPGLAIDLRNLCRVIDYPARDMTITVQASITIARLQELLAVEHQRLPIDVPLADRATLGGILAANVSGPRRYGCGTLRDYVIGISVVNDEGHEVKAGGRVVKNVAGYDLCKLHIGALGTLGIITQVTLKLRPLPEETALVLVPCETETVAGLLDQLHRSRTRPICIDLLNQAATRYIYQQTRTRGPEASWLVVVGYEDTRETLNWQVQQFVKELSGGWNLEARLGFTTDALWRALTEFPATGETGLTFKANILPSATASFCRAASALTEPLLLQAHAGNGIVVGHAAADLTRDRAASLLRELRELVAAAHGQVIVLRCPAAWKDTLFVWGSPRDVWLMRTVKEHLDPRRLFNPGRFVDGI